jgi:hypothetical protein
MVSAVTIIASLVAVVALITVGIPYAKDVMKQQAGASYPHEWVVKVSKIKDPSLKIEKKADLKEDVVEMWEDVQPENVVLVSIVSDKNKKMYFPAVNFGPENNRELVIVTPMNTAFASIIDEDDKGYQVSGYKHKKQRQLETYSYLHKKI